MPPPNATPSNKTVLTKVSSDLLAQKSTSEHFSTVEIHDIFMENCKMTPLSSKLPEKSQNTVLPVPGLVIKPKNHRNLQGAKTSAPVPNPSSAGGKNRSPSALNEQKTKTRALNSLTNFTQPLSIYTPAVILLTPTVEVWQIEGHEKAPKSKTREYKIDASGSSGKSQIIKPISSNLDYHSRTSGSPITTLFPVSNPKELETKKRKRQAESDPTRKKARNSVAQTPYQLTASPICLESMPNEIIDATFAFFRFEDGAWLYQLASLCPAFSNPALNALYYAPCFSSTPQLEKFIALLSLQNFPHNSKVRRLDISGNSVLLKVRKGGWSTLADLIPLIPRLQHLNIKPPFDPDTSCHSLAVFDQLINTRIKLQSWSWSFELFANFYSPTWLGLSTIHSFACFQSLRTLSVTYDNSQMTMADFNELGDALHKLASLKSLTLDSFHDTRCVVLQLLPQNLDSLTIINFTHLSSQILSSCLGVSGSHLRELILRENQTLELSFMNTIGVCCPALSTLVVYTTCHGMDILRSSSAPGFSPGLSPEAIQRWPRLLRSLELHGLYKWQGSGIEFLQSIKDAIERGDLSKLRFFTLSATIFVPPREKQKLPVWELLLAQSLPLCSSKIQLSRRSGRIPFTHFQQIQ